MTYEVVAVVVASAAFLLIILISYMAKEFMVVSNILLAFSLYILVLIGQIGRVTIPSSEKYAPISSLSDSAVIALNVVAMASAVIIVGLLGYMIIKYMRVVIDKWEMGLRR